MIDNYWKFILGLQHNAQRYFDHKIAEYNIEHDWCDITHDLFMVRDLETNELLYDSIPHLIVDLKDQQIQDCQLIPSDLLFPEFTQHFKQFIFDTSNYPIAVFLGRDQNFALVKIHAEKVKKFSMSTDPREFSGFASSQNYNKYLLFTLIRLDQKQLTIVDEFKKSANWKNSHEHFQSMFLDSPFNFRQDKSLRLTNNLFLKNEITEYPFLDEPSPEFNLAFSWINRLCDLQEQIKTEVAMTLDSRSPYSSIIDQNFSAISLFQEDLNNALINLVSHSANSYEKAYVNEDLSYIPSNSLQHKTQINIEANNEFNSDSTTDEKPTSVTASTLYLIFFLAVVIGLLYGVFWLVNHYEFAKFMVITAGVIIFLMMWSKK
ncbi:hypothetical protein [Acinetobacter sp. MD2(2019)]|uniref:hypothetical protein n=1 Tax=Acinetobacter sp. MD2(2019) TaxID=2605273 RepID=UPI002D1E6164|nr:hypothetical protein [Acinetobacter sp. MD2(2019)]MEB3753652.1 hypothetical protein [Acinetobacter sp. MD2(2019)]